MLLLSLFRVEATLEMCGVHRDPSALHLLISRRFRPQEVIEKAQAEAAELQANSDEPRKNKHEKKKNDMIRPAIAIHTPKILLKLVN